jgi:CheY-like chemotaxis protein
MPLSDTARPITTAGQLPTLLIVGDPIGLDVAREALVELELGWEVVFADSAADAHATADVRPADVILIDLANPHVDGVALVDALHVRCPHAPIVLMTAPYGVSVALEAMRKGAANHFPRDLLDSEPAAVLETLRATAQAHCRRRQAANRLTSVSFEFTLDNDLAQVPAVVGRVADACVEAGLCDRLAASRVAVALEECLANAIVHGNLEVPGELRQRGEAAYHREIQDRRGRHPYAGRRATLSAHIAPTKAEFVVHDDGPGFDVSGVPDPTDESGVFRVGGRGILLMRSFMTEVHFSDRGNRVTLVKRKG